MGMYTQYSVPVVQCTVVVLYTVVVRKCQTAELTGQRKKAPGSCTCNLRVMPLRDETDGSTGSHRLGWNRLGYGEMTEELRVPCDHLEKLHFLRPSVLKLALF